MARIGFPEWHGVATEKILDENITALLHFRE
jgi:hypothetical protein